MPVDRPCLHNPTYGLQITRNQQLSLRHSPVHGPKASCRVSIWLFFHAVVFNTLYFARLCKITNMQYYSNVLLILSKAIEKTRVHILVAKVRDFTDSCTEGKLRGEAGSGSCLGSRTEKPRGYGQRSGSCEWKLLAYVCIKPQMISTFRFSIA